MHDLSFIQSVATRYANYLSAAISTEIAPCDDMFNSGHTDHYFSVGRSAINIIAESMIRARRTSFASVLDLPCGGGRVTRHLQQFLPDAALFVSDVNKQKESFVVETFGVQPIRAATAFDQPLGGNAFDLIFSGSLVTHLGAEHFERCIRWLCAALAPTGLLIVTTQGRTNSAMSAHYSLPEWKGMHDTFVQQGFGFQPFAETVSDEVPYGGSLASPSWLMSLAERIKDVGILSYSEGAWDQNQDALVLKKAPFI